MSISSAKMLLTLHPKGPDAWFESVIGTIYFTESMWQFKVLELLTPFGRKFGDMLDKLAWERSLKGTMPDKAKAIAVYNAWAEEVRAAVPADRLLVFKVSEGWGPLCAFSALTSRTRNSQTSTIEPSSRQTLGAWRRALMSSWLASPPPLGS
jgi:hypothetical protein